MIREALEQLPRSVPILRRYFNSVVSTNHAGMPVAPLAFHYSLYFHFKFSQPFILSWLIVVVRKMTILMLKGVSQQHIWKPNEVVWTEIHCTWRFFFLMLFPFSISKLNITIFQIFPWDVQWFFIGIHCLLSGSSNRLGNQNFLTFFRYAGRIFITLADTFSVYH